MKINATDEYGLRILIRLAKVDSTEGLTIPQLSDLEGISSAYVAKLTRMLKTAELINSQRGYTGGYVLAKSPKSITISEVLNALGGRLYDKQFCNDHSGQQKFCTNSIDCSVRSLWKMVQSSMDQLLNKITIHDLIDDEQKSLVNMSKMLEETLS